MFSIIVFDTHLISSRIQRHFVITAHRSSRDITVIWSYFSVTWQFSTNFQKIFKYQNLLISVQWGPSCSKRAGGRADGRTDRQTCRS